MNHNVRLVWIYSFLDSVCRGIYAKSVLSGFLYHISNGSNAKVGLAEGLQGISQAAMAIPAGLSTDKYGRANVLKVTGLCLGLTMGFFVVILFIHDSFFKEHLFWFIAAALMLLGGEWSFCYTGIATIYADSVPSDERTWYNNMRRILLLSGAVTGPVLAIILFTIAGDSWTFMELRLVFAAGLILRALTSIVLLFFDDSKTLGSESAALVGKDRNVSLKYIYLVPYIMTSSDFIKAFASGMTVKFWPLFFKNETHMSPIPVNTISAITLFLLIFGVFLSGRLSKHIGRIQTLLLVEPFGILLLALMGHLKSKWVDWRVIVPIYSVRTIFINSCAGIRKSVLMDFVRKTSRGKWNAVDGVTRLSWSGSALVGGLLIDKYGYGSTFYITAILQFIAYGLLIPLLYIIPSEKRYSNSLLDPILTAASIQGKIMSQKEKNLRIIDY